MKPYFNHIWQIWLCQFFSSRFGFACFLSRFEFASFVSPILNIWSGASPYFWSCVDGHRWLLMADSCRIVPQHWRGCQVAQCWLTEQCSAGQRQVFAGIDCNYDNRGSYHQWVERSIDRRSPDHQECDPPHKPESHQGEPPCLSRWHSGQPLYQQLSQP